MGYGAFIDIPLQLLGPIFPLLFDPVFGPLLNFGSPSTGAWLVILAVAAGFSALLTALHFVLVDRERHEELQERQKELKEKQGEDPEDVDVKENMGQMKDLMFEQMRMTMKVNVVSMLIVILLFPWLYTTFSPVADISGEQMGGEMVFNGETVPFTVDPGNETAAVVIDGETFSEGETFKVGDLPFKVKNVDAEAGEVRFETVLWYSPVGLPFTGKDVGWLGTYILVVLPFSIIFRKLAGLQ